MITKKDYYTKDQKSKWLDEGLEITMIQFFIKPFCDFGALQMGISDFDFSISVDIRFCNMNGAIPIRLVGDLFARISQRESSTVSVWAFTNAKKARTLDELVFKGWCDVPIEFDGDSSD